MATEIDWEGAKTIETDTTVWTLPQGISAGLPNCWTTKMMRETRIKPQMVATFSLKALTLHSADSNSCPLLGIFAGPKIKTQKERRSTCSKPFRDPSRSLD